MDINKIYQGDTLAVLKTFPDECVDCIITSPPYYGLRDYGVEGQIGLEKTLDEYLEKMLSITAELKRVLKKTGTMWWNHGDSYHGDSPVRVSASEQFDLAKQTVLKRSAGGTRRSAKREGGITAKSLTLQSFRLVQRMIDEQQWILRNVIIWHKPNVMPSSVKDRFTVDFEPVFFFVKSKKYWFEPQYEPHNTSIELQIARIKAGRIKAQSRNKGDDGLGKTNYQEKWISNKPEEEWINPLGRNKRCVWKIPTAPFKEAHFATFPEKLIEPMIKAGCPEGGIVLDPFMGAGTTAVVAKKLNRQWVGIELNSKYVEMANRRIAAVPERLI